MNTTTAPATPDQLLFVLSHHIGKGNGIGVKQLAERFGVPERQVRKLISALRDRGQAICGTPQHGYYIASDAEELQETCEFLRSRAMHSLGLESKLRKIPLADLIGQLHLPT
jgi:biotin operon repressor